MTDEPLIYTTKGNLPISSLEFKFWWMDNDVQVSYHEQYLLDGEVVKESAAVKLKQGVTAQSDVGGFNG